MLRANIAIGRGDDRGTGLVTDQRRNFCIQQTSLTTGRNEKRPQTVRLDALDAKVARRFSQAI